MLNGEVIWQASDSSLSKELHVSSQLIDHSLGKNVSGKFDTIHRADLRISDIGNLLGSDWVRVAHALDIADSDINIIKSEYPDNNGKHPDPRLRIQRQISDFFAAGNIGYQCCKQGRRAGSMTDLLY